MTCCALPSGQPTSATAPKRSRRAPDRLPRSTRRVAAGRCRRQCSTVFAAFRGSQVRGICLSALALVLALPASGGRLAAGEPDAWLERQLPSLVELYRDLHRNPELSLAEEKTAERLAGELRSVGAEVTTRVGGFGVVGVLANGDGPTLMFRTDTDALPVAERTELPYASQVRATGQNGSEVGVMHACGHDIHMTNLVGTARWLAAHRDRWRGTVVFVCQPAEERGLGAAAMLADGLFERFPRPELALALHVDSTLPSGQVGYRAGFALANVDSVDITLVGRGGHGAYPHSTVDPIVMAAHLVLDLQTIVSREIDPQEPAVVTVGSIRGGTKHNVIADKCHLQLTVRSFSAATRDHLLDAIRRKALAVAHSARAPEPEIAVSEGTPAMRNDPALVERVLPSLRRALGEANVVEGEPSMGGEDFSRYEQAGVPIFMFRLGAVDARRLEAFKRQGLAPPSLHSATFYPDAELTLATGLRASTAAIVDLLPPVK